MVQHGAVKSTSFYSHARGNVDSSSSEKCAIKFTLCESFCFNAEGKLKYIHIHTLYSHA